MSSFPPVGQLDNAAAIPPVRRLRVLLVEDNADDAALLRRYLSRAGFSVELLRVETAEKMLDALSAPDALWDCILADYNLPQFSAPEALRLLQETGRDIPFIMMSGAVNEATAVAAMRAGAHDYVSKENLTRLVPAIERELAEAASRRVKRATERALRSSEERFHRLVEATPLALLISDMQGRVTYANRGAERLLGVCQADVEKRLLKLDTFFPPAEFGPVSDDIHAGEHISRGLHRKLASHGGETWESSCCHADRTRIPVLLGAAVLNPEATQDLLQLAVFFVDLRAQKRGEEVLRRTEKLAAAGRLAASIAHEINNPLEAIVNCLYLVEQGALEESSREYLRMAQAELDRVTQITTQTLRFYRQSTRPQPTAIPDLLDSVLTLYEARLRDYGIDVVRDYDNAPPIVALDGEIRQVLANIIGNAVDAMMSSNGTRMLTIRASSRRSWRTGEPGMALLIADTGGGIPKETLARIYEPFFSTKGITGTGLGLWVSSEIIDKHNGRILVRSREATPSGTIFRIYLPLSSPLSDRPYEAGLPTLA